MAYAQNVENEEIGKESDDHTPSLVKTRDADQNYQLHTDVHEKVKDECGASAGELQPVISGVEYMTTDSSAVPSEDSRKRRLKPVELNISLNHTVEQFDDDVMVFNGEWDEEGVYVYQAFNDKIASYALTHQTFGGPFFQANRMTWVKPSFAWVLYRSGYGMKRDQNHVLKIKLSHESLATLLSHCECKAGGGGSKGRVQWDPERDILTSEGGVPRKMLRRRAIQIGFSQELSHCYVANTMSIQDVTPLAKKVHYAHQGFNKKTSRDKTAMEFTKEEMAKLGAELPNERPYMPCCVDSVLLKLKLVKKEWILDK